MAIPNTFQTVSENLVFNIDYFDYASGAGYKRFYFLGCDDSVGNKYVLTEDSSLASDNHNYQLSNGDDKDFDLTFQNPVIIEARDCYVQLATSCSGNDADTYSTVVTVYHVDASATETSLGTVTITDADADPTRYTIKTAKFALTRKAFKRGEKLRISIAQTSTASFKTFIDPAGTVTQTSASGGSWTSSSFISIPFKMDL